MRRLFSRYEGQIDNPLTMNQYTYVSNNPLRYLDPTGHWQEGDEKLSDANKITLEEITQQYWDAYDHGASADDLASIHAQAEDIRILEKAMDLKRLILMMVI